VNTFCWIFSRYAIFCMRYSTEIDRSERASVQLEPFVAAIRGIGEHLRMDFRRPRLKGLRATRAAWLASTCVCAVIALAGAPRAAWAQSGNLVTNGNFTQFSSTPSSSFQFGTAGYTPPQTLTDWSSTGYNFVFLPTSTSATGEYGALSLWSPVTGSNNGFTNASPTGGNFVAADGDYQTEAVTQQINGLTVGRQYTLSFAWAAAQQSGFTGNVNESWNVSLGSASQSTATYALPSEGFSGWMNQTMTFVATNTSEELSFLAVSDTPVPPFLLLANVSLVPEPAGILPLLAGVAGLGAVAWRRRRTQQMIAAVI
jgi:hypothetical protein